MAEIKNKLEVLRIKKKKDYNKKNFFFQSFPAQIQKLTNKAKKLFSGLEIDPKTVEISVWHSYSIKTQTSSTSEVKFFHLVS